MKCTVGPKLRKLKKVYRPSTTFSCNLSMYIYVHVRVCMYMYCTYVRVCSCSCTVIYNTNLYKHLLYILYSWTNTYSTCLNFLNIYLYSEYMYMYSTVVHVWFLYMYMYGQESFLISMQKGIMLYS